jgi:hypothetical protein
MEKLFAAIDAEEVGAAYRRLRASAERHLRRRPSF